MRLLAQRQDGRDGRPPREGAEQDIPRARVPLSPRRAAAARALRNNRWLTAAELGVLAAHMERNPRVGTLYMMALGLGLGARQLSGLDVRHASPDGIVARDLIELPAPGGASSGEVLAVSSRVKEVISSYLAWRRSRCSHHRHPLQSYRDGDGSERCHFCREAVDFLACPLFWSREGRRLSQTRICQEFAEIRDGLGLSKRLTFGSLRATSLVTANVLGGL